MSEIFKKRILKFLKHTDYMPLKLAQLAKAIGVSSEDYPQFKLAFKQLRQAGHVVIGTKNLVSLPPMPGQTIGTFRANTKGFGFITPLELNSHGDLFIPPNATASAMTGDIVTAKVVRKGKRHGQMRYSGKVVEILQRAQNRFVGILLKKPEGWIVQPDGTVFLEPISVDDIAAKGAREKDKVVVEIVSYPTDKYLARGVIVEVLGKAGQYAAEINSIIRQYHLPDEFSNDCIEQARRAAVEFNPKQLYNREDITEKVIITIDPPNAKDFDDAISLWKDERDNWVLGIHIADVSNFVPADSSLDAEAKIRGNSIYLPGKTIPMLPEVLSNGICSLQPGQERFCKSVYLTYDKRGKILSRSFANSVICSKQRLAYREADEILKGHIKGVSPEVVELLKNMEVLARVIEKRRINNGMLHLNLPEVKLALDKTGRVTNVFPADNSYPHTIIEMFMVEANDAAASVLDRLDIPLMRRIHPEPDSLSMKNLAKLIKKLGFTMPRNPDRAAIQDLLAAVKSMDCSLAINLLVLRSLEKAQYSLLHISHFALASNHYCHFTSPIRRYADLLVHRLLESYLQKNLEQRCQQSDLADIGKHITFTEQRAADAEKELKNVMLLQMLSNKIGSEFACLVTGLTGFGIFVRLLEFGIEGLIVIGDLGPDEWKYDAKNQYIMGLGSGVSIHFGQSIKARIVSVNIPARQLNLVPAEALIDTSKKTKKKKVPKTYKRRKQKTRRSRP